jgi:hypothetical protein
LIINPMVMPHVNTMANKPADFVAAKSGRGTAAKPGTAAAKKDKAADAESGALADDEKLRALLPPRGPHAWASRPALARGLAPCTFRKPSKPPLSLRCRH